MTETDGPTADAAPAAARGARRKEGLDAMLLPELKQVATRLGLKVSGMRKGQLVDAIKAAQGGSSGGSSTGSSSSAPSASAEAPVTAAPVAPAGDQTSGGARRRRGEQAAPEQSAPEQSAPDQTKPERKAPEQKAPEQKAPEQKAPEQKAPEQKAPEQPRTQDRNQDQQDDDEQGGSRRNRRRRGRDRDRGNQNDRQNDASQDSGRDQQGQNRGQDQNQNRDQNRDQGRGQDRQDRQDRGQQGRNQQDRDQGRNRRGEPDLQILEDDVLAPCAGILDLLDNYAFVRTSGYLPGPEDVYVSMSMVRKHGLRRGDAVAGMVRQPREGERREKFNPLVRIDTVNGADPERARQRVDFGKLTPVNPSERLRLETSSGELVGRALDLVTPLGKGQRGLVLSPAKAGKTTVLQAMAAALTSNNPECHVMVVLVDERPEEVTDYARSIKGEVISSTFDRPPSDHTLVAELALERAKRLVELGHDVVLLLDGMTRLARAYDLAAASGGRGNAGVLDAAAVHQPKKFFGAARNIENGGSLTIVATASVGGGSLTDAAILEELEGTENMELRLCRPAPGTEVFPVFDVLSSGTRREELLLSDGELQAVRRLRRSLDTLEHDAAARRLAEQLRGSTTNLELLRAPRA